jgi:phosphate:Na+ symporter
MGGLAEQLHPADLPAVTAAAGAGWWSGMLGVLILVVVGLVMTAVMQSSTAAIAVTLSAYYAGAVGLDQACALIIGQNIGTATSSALAAIGASSTAKRLALAYILFKLIAAVIALVLFPIVTPMLVRASNTIDGVTLLAAYHTAYNVVGVLVLLPIVDGFTRFVERILPERGSPLTRCLDPAALATPIAAVEGARRTVARALEAMCGFINARLETNNPGGAVRSADVSIAAAADALRQTQVFITDVSGPPETEEDQRRLTSILHALDHASRLAEAASKEGDIGSAEAGLDETRVAQLCVDAMGNAALVAAHVAAQKGVHESAGSISSSHGRTIADGALVELERSAKELNESQPAYRAATLGAVGSGALTADEAIARVEAARRLEVFAHHAWRCAFHLAGDRA